MMHNFKEGDIVEAIQSCSGSIGGQHYRLHASGSEFIMYELSDTEFRSGKCSCPHNRKLISTEKTNNPVAKIMSTIVDTFKNLTLSADEKLLRKHGLKDSNGNYTSDAREIALVEACIAAEAKLIEVAKAKEAEETKK